MSVLGALVPFLRGREKAMNSVPGNGGWFRIMEPFAGAWQRNVEIRFDSVVSNHTFFACVTLIASDIAKLGHDLVQEDTDGVWLPTTNSAYSPVINKPNHYQNRIQFVESWIISKLLRGNTYVLKERDNRNVVVALYVLDPNLVTPLVADDGSIFYRLSSDKLSGVVSEIIVPASEIIHDRMNCFFHPLVGLSPIFASGLAAVQGTTIQEHSASFFKNQSMPSGILTAKGDVTPENAARLKAQWEENYGGKNVGKIVVAAGGLEFKSLSIDAVDAQLIEQLKMTGEVICSTFHMPPYKAGVGQMPTYNNIQALNVEYYSQCLQRHIEDFELCLDEGLGLASNLGIQVCVDNLLRMDSVSQAQVEKDLKGIKAPNESRRVFGLKKVDGGDSPLAQQQDYSLAALAKRDAGEDPFGTKPQALPKPDNDDEELAAQSREALLAVLKGLS